MRNKIENDQRKDYLQRLILETVKTAGLISISVIAPNVLKSMKQLGFIQSPRQKEYIASSASRMVKNGLLEFNGRYYELTSLGEKLLRRWKLSNYHLEKPRKWDGKWRMVIFDIPEKKRGIRKQVTSIFTQAGLVRLQDSVWVYPYDCEKIIGLMKTELGVGKDILYVIANKIENDKYLKKEFDL